MKKYLTTWQLWAIISTILMLVILLNSYDLSSLLPFAVFLICPLMMLFMMKDHHKH